MNDQVSGRDWAPVSSMNRVCTGPGKPGKSWKKATGPGKVWKSVKLK